MASAPDVLLFLLQTHLTMAQYLLLFNQLHETLMVKLHELLDITLHQINTNCGSKCTARNIKLVHKPHGIRTATGTHLTSGFIPAFDAVRG